MERISHFEIHRLLGRGGMGEVHEAIDLDLGRRVALKFVAAPGLLDPDALRRFEREARVAAALQHPGIATLYAFDRTTDRPFLVLELLEGRTLREVLAAGPLPVPRALAIGRAVAEALAYAHRRGVVHRDLKPENLMFDAEGRIKLTDFGLAREAGAAQLTLSGTAVGTAAYLAPETFVGEPGERPAAARSHGLPAGAPADVFALGVTLHELLAGRRPFRGEGVHAVMMSIANDPPRPLEIGLPTGVADLLARMLDKRPEARPASEEVARALASALGEPAPAAWATPGPAAVDSGAVTRRLPDARAVATRRESRVRPAVRAGLAIAVLLLAAAAVVAVRVGLRRTAEERHRRAIELVNAGHDSLAAGALEAARERFAGALALSPAYPEARLDLAVVQHRLGEHDDAARLFGEVLATSGDRADLRAEASYGLGDIDLQARAWPSAIQHLEEALRADSSRVEYPNNLAFALVGAGRAGEALATLREARRRFPGEPALLKNEALAWFAQGRFDSALAAAREAVRIRPGYAAAWSLRARSEAALGDVTAARASLATLRDLAPDPDELSAARNAVAMAEARPH